MRRTSALTAILLAATLALAACGSDSGDSTTGDTGVTVTGEPGEKPTLEIPDAEPSSELEVEVIEEGDGAEVGTDDFVVAHYLGQTWEPVDGEANIFDNSYDRKEASGFSLNGVIEGWKEGLTGQKVGSRVLLSIPPDQGYGDQDSGSIPANSTLVFVVDLVDVVPPDAGVSGAPAAELAADLPVVEGEGDAEATVTFSAASAVPAASDATVLISGDGDELGENAIVQIVQASYATQETQYSSRSTSGALALKGSELPGLAEALEGQKVGTRVLVRIAAADNVTEAAPEGEPLAIVVDVVGTF